MLNKEKLILNDIIEKIKRIEITLKNVEFKQFILDEDKKDIVLYNLIILGEASKNLIKVNVKFKKNKLVLFLKKNRNNLTHQYWISREENQWVLIKEKLPQIKEEIENKIKELKEK